MIHASQVKIEQKSGISYNQIVQSFILDKICKELTKGEHYKKWTTVLTEVKINSITEQILNLYGYRIKVLDNLGSQHLYDIEWN